MKRIAIILHDTEYTSGATRSMCDVIENLRKYSNIDIIVIASSRKGTVISVLSAMGIPIIYSKFYVNYRKDNEGIFSLLIRFPVRCVKLAISILSAYQLIPVLKKKKIDIVYSNTSVIVLGAYIKKFCPDVKHIWHIREFGREDQGLLFFGGIRYLLRLLNKYTDRAIFISNSLAKKYQSNLKISFSTIYDDVSPEYVQFPKHRYKEKTTMKILIVGRIVQGKNQFDIIKAVKYLTEMGISVVLDIVGDTKYDLKYTRMLDKYIDKYNLHDHVNFLGQVINMNELRKNYDFGVVCSPMEAFGRVTIEGMLSGLLMIGADAGCTAEIIRDNINGKLYPCGDSKKLALILEELYNSDTMVEQIKMKGFNYACQFTKGRCANEIYKIISEDGI